MKKSDWIIIGIGLVVALLTMGGLKLQQVLNDTDKKIVEVYSKGQLIDTFDINEDGRYLYELPKGMNEFVIENGEAYMLDADCPELTCLDEHAISHVNETIVCLPNQFHLLVVGNEEVEIDAISE